MNNIKIMVLSLFAFAFGFLNEIQAQVDLPNNQSSGLYRTQINSNPALTNPSVIIDKTINEGKIYFDYIQNLSDYAGAEDAPLKLTISLFNLEPINGIASVVGDFANRFEWEYSEDLNTFRGTQIKTLEQGLGQIEINVKPQNGLACSSENRLGFNANIQPAPSMNGANDTSDDHIDSYNCELGIISNVAEQASDKGDYSAYPNPFSDSFTLTRNTIGENTSVEVYDQHGRLIVQKNLSSNEEAKLIELGNIASSFVIVKIKSKEDIDIIKLNKIYH